MNNSATCLNIYRFTKKMEECLPFQVTLTKLALLSCLRDSPKYPQAVAKLMGLTPDAVSSSVKEMSSPALVKRSGGAGSAYEITNLGRNLLSAFYQAVTGGVFYEAPRTKEPVPTVKGKRSHADPLRVVRSDGSNPVDGASPYSGEESGESLDFCVAT